MKIVVLDGRTLAAEGNSWAVLQQLGEVEVHDHSTLEEVASRSNAAAILVTNKAPVPADVIERALALRFIAVSATGHDCVDEKGDTPWGHRGRTYSHGYMRALVQGVNAM